MKCLSLTQPFATLVAIGAKRIETRSWPTAYRGPLAIHASKRYPQECRYLAMCDSTFARAFKSAGIETPEVLPTGVVLATCTLARCVPTDLFEPVSEQERAFGDYGPKRWAWILEDVRPLPEPIPARGALGLWSWEMPADLAGRMGS